MKHARVVHQGLTHGATEKDGWQLLLDDGQVVSPDAVTWLPPVKPVLRPRTILALQANYRNAQDPAAAPEEPLAVLKGEGALAGHHQSTRRPAGAQRMLARCGLAVVIGRTARRVRRADAPGFIAGYTVVNDYGFPELEDGRSGLQARNRDGATLLGPWLVDAGDVPDPMALALRTTVSGQQVQAGSTADMLFDVPSLLEYFTGFMTLQPGDLLLTGALPGAVDCRPGDVVATEVEGVGVLVNTIQG